MPARRMAYARPGNASLVSASINRQMVIKTRGQRPSSIETQYRILTLNSELYDLFCHKGPPLSQEQMPPTGGQYFKMGFVRKNENLTQERRQGYLEDTFMCFSVRRPKLERLSQVFVPAKETEFLLRTYRTKKRRTISNASCVRPKHLMLPHHKLHPE